MTEILPCPFCGSEPIFPEAKDVYDTHYDAGCKECCIAEISISIIDCFEHARQHVRESYDREKYQYGIEYIDVVRKEAIKIWNRRVA